MMLEQMELNRDGKTNKKMRSSLLWCLPILSLLLWMSDAQAQGRTFALKQGAVMARSLALDENKQPILVEYNEQGEEISKVAIPGEYAMDVAKLKVITAFEYHQEKLRLDKFEEIHQDDLWKDAEVMALDKFKQTEFVSADGKTSIAVPTLPSYVKSVLVRGRSARINPDPKELVLLSFSVDLSEQKTVPEKGSVLINDKGQVLYTSTNNIAPRVGFFGDPNKKQELYSGIRKPDDEIYGPVKYVKVYISPEVFPGSMSASDFRGKYSMSFMLPYCPGGFEYTTDIWAELRYANFSPFGSPTIPYYLRRQDWTYCYDLPPFGGGTLGAAMSYVNAMASLATMAVPMYNADFKVDVMFLSGRILLKNPDGSPISVGTDTQYHVADSGSGTTAQAFYDFDGDGKSDRSVVGDIKDEVQADGSVKKVFFERRNGAYQGVYFSSQPRADGKPNVIRLADKGDRQKPNGLLKSISTDDFKNTDIYVFRESTGQLVLERNGLKDEEVAGRVDIGLGKDDKYYYYRLMLRGPSDTAINVGAINRSKNWEDWAEEYRLAEPFRKRESDYLKSGEWVRLVVINRATGYMGTQRIQLGDASKNAGSMLSVKLDDTYLQPPNLKIWAERDYTQTSGLEQNKQQKNNIIGMEGASLDTDDIIRVYTEWLDEDGRPLPEGLSADNGEQYGLTGRLAKVGSPNQLVGVAAGSLASFPIAPGMSTQVLRLKDNLTTPEHFYVHVVGEQKDENPDFGTDPTEAPPLDTRPKNATPFLVPIFDENKHWKTWSAWNQLQRAYDAEELDEKPLKPKGSYVWHARPEYQFSQLALEIQKIEREYTTESGETKTQELLVEQEDEGKIPTIRANDDLVRVFYSLLGNSNNPLLPIDGEQELVFGFGASEVRATIGANGEIVFKDLSHIDSLDPTDLLTLRLYVNHDAGNTLWEWAFTRNGLHVFYEVPGNTQEKSKRALPTIADVNCTGSTCSDIEILALLAAEDTNSSPPAAVAPEQPAPKVRTLGGMRLRLRYIPPSLDGIKITKVTWKMGYKGRYCNQYGVTTLGCNVVSANQEYEQTHPYTPVLPTETGDWSVYWEPVSDDQNKTDWSNWAGTETDDKGMASSLNAEYTVPVKAGSGDTPTSKVQTRRFSQDFTMLTRELKPATGTEKPMQGSDVAMLEAMLWQFGISPTEKPGSSTRTAPNLRDQFIWLNGSVGSVARQMGRFNYHQLKEVPKLWSWPQTTPKLTGDPIAKVGEHWQHFYQTYSLHKNVPEFKLTDLTKQQIESAVAVFDGTIQYPQPIGKSFASIAPTYTEDAGPHSQIETMTGVNFERKDILFAFAQREVSGVHWRDKFRVRLSAAGETAARGFAQILNGYTYGVNVKCEEVAGYWDGKSNVNHYDPGHSLMTKALWLSMDRGDCRGVFYYAYGAGSTGKGSLKKTYQSNSGVKLMRIISGGEAPQVQDGKHEDDAYELLGKSIAGYYQGRATLSNVAWVAYLIGETCPPGSSCYKDLINKDISFNEKSDNNKLPENERKDLGEITIAERAAAVNITSSKAIEYAIDVMHGGNVTAGQAATDNGKAADYSLKLPYRQYVWKGGKYPKYEFDENGEIKNDENDQPILHPKSEQDWCFAYGEQEWMNGVGWNDAKSFSERYVFDRPKENTKDYRIGCN